MMTFDWTVVWDYREAFLRGAAVTILLAVASMGLAIPGGIILALMRLSPFRFFRIIATIFVEFCRNIPLILVIYWAYYVLPRISGISATEFTTGLIGIAAYASAYNSETFRAGINSIRRGQSEAAIALGMSSVQVMTRVVLPQAIKRILPVLATTWVALFKDTAIVSVIGVHDLAYVGLEVRAMTLRVFETLTTMMVIYWLMGYPQAKIVDWIYRKWRTEE